MSLSAFVWGAWFALACTTISIVGSIAGAETTNVLLADPMRAAGAGFLWGILVWNIREWFIDRRHRRE